MGKVRVALWDAINEYTKACRGNPSRHVYGNTIRELSVSAVERAVDAEVSTLTRERDEARQALDEREADMHARIRAAYDKTVADCWRAKVAEVERERDEARATLTRAVELIRLLRDRVSAKLPGVESFLDALNLDHHRDREGT